MNGIKGLVVRIYLLLLHAYPRQYINAFGDEMRMTFHEGVLEAISKSNFSAFILREFVETPGALFNAYLYGWKRSERMLWTNKPKRLLRIMLLTGLVISAFGPWFFDNFQVQSPDNCIPPNIMGEYNYCAKPVSFVWYAFTYGGPYLRFDVIEPFALIMYLPVLTLFSTLGMILIRSYNPWQFFHILLLGLAAIFSVYNVYIHYIFRYPILWGVSVFIIFVVILLAFEIFTFHTRDSHKNKILALNSSFTISL
jgi:hypothetical protein